MRLARILSSVLDIVVTFHPSIKVRIDAFRRPLDEFTFVDNRRKRLAILNRNERPSKRTRTKLIIFSFSLRIDLLILSSPSVFSFISSISLFLLAS